MVLARRGVLPIDLPAPLYFLGALGPILSAVIHTWREAGWPGLRLFFSRLILWRVPVRWYAVALLLPTIASIPAALLVLTASEERLDVEFASLSTLVPTFIALMLFLPTEEAGWRGYALPRIQQSRSALSASVVVGLGWAFWHLPAFWFSGVFETTLQVLLAFAVFLPLTVAISVLFTWIYNATRGSVLIATAHHAAYAIGLGITNIAIERLALFFVAYAATLILIACAVVRMYGAANLSRGKRIGAPR